MTDKEKLEKIKALADKMYSRISYLTSDTRPIRQAMDEYHQFIINEYHKEEPVSIDFEQELYKAFGQVKDFTLGMRIAKWFYDMGKNSQEPESEELEEAAERLSTIFAGEGSVDPKREGFAFYVGFKNGANWQKEQMMAKAIDATVHIDAGGYPYIPQMELYDYDKDVSLAEEGEKVKVIVIKED